MIFHNKLWKTCFVILLLSIVLSSQNALTAEAEPESLTLLYADEWSATYVNAVSLSASDVDGDGVVEIITVGVIENGAVQGQLRISTWGPPYNVEVDESFTIDDMYTMANDVAASDLNDDGTIEIVVVGTAWDSENKYYAWIRVYSWDNTTLTLDDTYVRPGNDATYTSVVVGDLDGDGIADIFAGGRISESPTSPFIVWFEFSADGGLEVIDSTTWFYPGAEYQILTDIVVRNYAFGNWDLAAVSYFVLDGEALGELSIFTVDPFTFKIEQTDYVTIPGEGDTVPHSVSAYNQYFAVAGGAYSSAGLGRGGLWLYDLDLNLIASGACPSGEPDVPLWWNGLVIHGDDPDALGGILFGATPDGVAVKKIYESDWEQIAREDLEITMASMPEYFSTNLRVPFGGFLADVNGDGEKELGLCGNANDYEQGFMMLFDPHNEPPTAYIDTISPNPMYQGTEVSFTGHGTDPDGTIIEYKWTSSIDGQLSTSQSFNTSLLSSGITHTIYLQVQDDDGTWSTAVTQSLEVISNERPTAYIDTISPNPANQMSQISFTGHGTDPDGAIVEYEWKTVGNTGSHLVSTSQSFSSTLTPSNYTITLRVRDNNGVWSLPVSQSLEVKYVEPPPEDPFSNIPGFPLESIIIGLLSGAAFLVLVKRRRLRVPMPK